VLHVLSYVLRVIQNWRPGSSRTVEDIGDIKSIEISELLTAVFGEITIL